MRYTSLLLLTFLSYALWSQSASELGWMPGGAISFGISEHWKITGQFESRQNVWSRSQGESFQMVYEYVRTDFTAIISYKLKNPLWSLSGGYMLRLTQGEQVHRSLQQIAFTQGLNNLRLGHRLRADQTFRQDVATVFRFRYRLSGELPLQGESLNDREFYLKVGNEQVASVQSSKWDWEVRLLGNLGYQINSRLKLETGIDYRIDRLIDHRSRHRAWWTVGGYWKL